MIDDTIYNADFGTAIKKLIERSNNIYKKIAIRTTELIKNYHRSNDKIKSIVITSGRGARAQEADLRSLKDVIADSLVEFLDFARQHNSNLVEHAKMQIQIEHSNDPTVIDIAAETKEDLEYYKKKNTNALGILLSKASEWINDYLIHSQHSSRQFSRQLSRQHSHSTPGPGEDSTKKLLDEAAKRLSSRRSLNREESDSSAVSSGFNRSESVAKLQEKIDEVSSHVLGSDQLSVPSVKKIKAVGAIMPSQPSSPAAGASLSGSLSGSLSRTLSSPSVSSWKWMMSQSPVMDGSQLSRQPSMESLRRAPSGVGSMGAASGRKMFRIDERGESGQEADKQSNAVESASTASASASASGTEKDSSMQEGGGKVKKIKKQNKEKNIVKSKSSNVKILRLNKPTKDTKKPSKTTTKKPTKTTTKKPSKDTKKPSKTTTKTLSKATTKKPSKDTKKPLKDTKKPTKSNTKTTSKPTTKKPTKILNKKTNKFKIIKFKH